MCKNLFIVSVFVVIWTLFSSFTIDIDNIIKVDKSKIIFNTIPYMVDDSYFIQAYDEITRILEDKDSLSIKRAQFLAE